MRTANFTDIHFGKKNNSHIHNQDCLDFISFFCDNVRKDNKITHVVFLGDWFENRNAVNVMTMNYAHEGLRLLNDLNLPIIILVGNHDLYHRENRKIFSTKIFDEFSNVRVISEPQVIEDALFCPFLFKAEYPSLAKFNNLPFWYGHFEFRNFVMTGTHTLMDHGPDHKQFTGPTYILSGHFHKRQAVDNVIYMGNAFPMDYGDAGDDDRGMMIVDHSTFDVDFINWQECPVYVKTSLSKVVNGLWVPREKARIRCLLDMDITYSEVQILKEEFMTAFNLREFSIEENALEKKGAISDGLDVDFDINELTGLDDTVRMLIATGVQSTTTIEANKLIEIYNEL